MCDSLCTNQIVPTEVCKLTYKLKKLVSWRLKLHQNLNWIELHILTTLQRVVMEMARKKDKTFKSIWPTASGNRHFKKKKKKAMTILLSCSITSANKGINKTLRKKKQLKSNNSNQQIRFGQNTVYNSVLQTNQFRLTFIACTGMN